MRIKKLLAVFLLGTLIMGLTGCATDKGNQQEASSGEGERLAGQTVAIATPYLTSATTKMMVEELETAWQPLVWRRIPWARRIMRNWPIVWRIW